MCLNPLTIPTPTRYVSLKYRNQYLIDVPCGHCSECAQTISNQWYYRSFYEWDDLSSYEGSYVLFDCLTYSNVNLPYLSDFWTFLDSRHEDFPCFNRKHLRNFLQSLRMRLIRLGYAKDVFRYFVASEYGTDKKATHRPHYHLMLFVRDKRLNPLFLSKLISKLWKFGRTDGVPYKSNYYVMGHNYIDCSGSNFANRLRSCRYVTKYVQKSCLFQSELDKRISVVMSRAAQFANPDDPDSWLSSELGRRERLRLLRFVNQFHLQSQHFGESALADIDLLQLERDGCLYMPDSNGVRIPIPLPMYYKRKLMQELVTLDGARYWVNTEYGDYYRSVRSDAMYNNLVDRYQCVVDFYHLNVRSVPKLVDYVLYIRGRVKADLPEASLLSRYSDTDLFNYVTSSDKLQFGTRGLSSFNFGDSQRGYISDRLLGLIRVNDFVARYTYIDSDFERELSLIKSFLFRMNGLKEDAFKLRQSLKQKFKPLILS